MRFNLLLLPGAIFLFAALLAGCGQATISSTPPSGTVTPDMYVSATYSSINAGGFTIPALPGSFGAQNTLTVNTAVQPSLTQIKPLNAASIGAIVNGVPLGLANASPGAYTASVGVVKSLTLNVLSPSGVAMSGNLILPATTTIPVTTTYGTFSAASGGAIGWSPVTPQPSNYVVFIVDVTATPTLVTYGGTNPFWNFVPGDAPVDPADNTIRFNIPAKLLTTGRQYDFCIGLLTNNRITNAKFPSLISAFSIDFSPLIAATPVTAQ